MTNRISELYDESGVYFTSVNPEVSRKEIEFYGEQVARECVRILEQAQGDLDFAIWKIREDFGLK
jgi:hypothetical protein